MKKFLFVLATGITVASFTGCATNSTITTEPATSTAAATETATEIETAGEPIVDETDVALETTAAEDALVGGWVKPESPALTDEVKGYFAKAFPDGTNTFYEPVALLGTQVVSGTNYKVLYRKISIGTSDAVDTYGIGTIYVDLKNNVEVLDVGELDVPTHLNEGGWTTYDVTDLTNDEKAAFQDAFNGMTGVSYDPIAVIAESDSGYYVLFEAQVVYPGTEPYYAVIEIKKTDTGNLEIGEIYNLVAENNKTS